jgi:four helix bundle protein
MGLAELAYRITRRFPKDELYGMTGQIRRSAVSIAANIAEGHRRENSGAFVQYLRMSQGSLKELETHLMLAMRVELAREEEVAPFLKRCDDLGKMTRSLIRSIQRRDAK